MPTEERAFGDIVRGWLSTSQEAMGPWCFVMAARADGAPIPPSAAALLAAPDLPASLSLLLSPLRMAFLSIADVRILVGSLQI